MSRLLSLLFSTGLQDPRYTEEKKKQIAEKKTQEEVFAEGVQIGSNLKLLAERRTDIFGMEETFIGQKIGEEEITKAPTVQWDGHAGRQVWSHTLSLYFSLSLSLNLSLTSLYFSLSLEGGEI